MNNRDYFKNKCEVLLTRREVELLAFWYNNNTDMFSRLQNIITPKIMLASGLEVNFEIP
jgi:hypothetical protein